MARLHESEIGVMYRYLYLGKRRSGAVRGTIGPPNTNARAADAVFGGDGEDEIGWIVRACFLWQKLVTALFGATNGRFVILKLSNGH
jgi:hypothetical protein